IASAFPAPPPYSKYFTKANLARLREVQSSNTRVNGGAITEVESDALPDPLRYLIPPEPPADGKYKSFGVQHDLNQPDLSLEAAGITQLYPSSPQSTDPTPKLMALSRAILLNFLELVGIMSNDPESSPEKIEDLQTLFYNTHDLINQYRPHQARESLIMMMEDQLKRSKDEITAVKESRGRMLELLKGIKEVGEGQSQTENGASLANGTNGYLNSDADGATLERKARQRAQWAALDAEFG
ncbi:mediator of RNA polymerase II transcription subunit 7, partial [Myriangium duriaei CBS 260.36]